MNEYDEQIGEKDALLDNEYPYLKSNTELDPEAQREPHENPRSTPPTNHQIPSEPPHRQQQILLVPPPYIVQGERQPIQFECPFCGFQGESKLRHENGLAMIFSLIICLIICCPLFWMPLCFDRVRDCNHVCPSCNRKIGRSRVL